jgi:hypothetical protein
MNGDVPFTWIWIASVMPGPLAETTRAEPPPAAASKNAEYVCALSPGINEPTGAGAAGGPPRLISCSPPIS